MALAIAFWSAAGVLPDLPPLVSAARMAGADRTTHPVIINILRKFIVLFSEQEVMFVTPNSSYMTQLCPITKTE
jgi:hypothetical protein